MELFVIIDYGISIGGIEVMLSDLAKFLSGRGYSVLFVIPSSDKSIYPKLIGTDNHNIKFVKVDGMGANIYIRQKSKTICSDQKIIKNYLNDSQQVHIITCFFYTLQYAMDLFSGICDNVNMLQIWSHPLEWVHRIVHVEGYVYRIKKNKLYYYQAELLKEITNRHASYFISKSIFDFNNWYYNTNLSMPENCWCAPVRLQKRDEYPRRRNIEGILHVLWIGRFTYFKNDAIIHIYNTLNKLSLLYPSQKFEFNVVGDGSEVDRKYVKTIVISNDHVTVNYYGTVSPDHLYEFYDKNDLGVSMGLSVKTMAASGLPSILIDSIGTSYKGENNCNWLFDIEVGDAGDGLYYQIMNKPLHYRENLLTIISDVILGRVDLNQLSKKCREYVFENYDFEKKNSDFIESAKKSQFHPTDIRTFHYNTIICLARNIFVKIRDIIR